MFLSPRWPAAEAIRDFFNGLKKTTIKEFLQVTNRTLASQSLYLMNPIDLIVLHKPVETSSTSDRKAVAASEIYDESDLVLSNVLASIGNYQPYNHQVIPESSPWGNFWDMGGGAFEPRGVVNWLEMTASDPPLDSIPIVSIPGTEQLPVESHVETSLAQDNIVPMSPTHPPIEINIESLRNATELLPACNRCRTRRIKCQRVSLECQQCKSSESACIYFDQLLSRNISSRSVQTDSYYVIVRGRQ